MPSNSGRASPFSVLTIPGMYLFYKYNEYKRHQEEIHKKKVTEKELEHLNHKIVSNVLLLFVISLSYTLYVLYSHNSIVHCPNRRAGYAVLKGLRIFK